MNEIGSILNHNFYKENQLKVNFNTYAKDYIKKKIDF